MKKYRVAVIGRTGKGNYGYSLDNVWLKCDCAEMVAVADEDEQRRAAVPIGTNRNRKWQPMRMNKGGGSNPMS